MEIRSAGYDPELQAEACRFEGLSRPFPSHFHRHYVLGLVESGERRLTWAGRELDLGPGDLLILAPGESHGCVQRGGALSYLSLHLPEQVMLARCRQITGGAEPPSLPGPVLRDEGAACCLRRVHALVLGTEDGMEKEEALTLLLSLLLRHGPAAEEEPAACRREVEAARAYLEAHLEERVTLAEVCRAAGLSAPALLRAFACRTGMTPYRYFEALRIDRARALLRQGTPPAEAALGKLLPELVGPDVTDGSGARHPGIVHLPVAVLQGSPETIRALRRQLYQPEFREVAAVDFSDLARRCATYGEFTAALEQTPESALWYLGVALCGPQRQVARLTGSLPLLR